MSDTLVLTVAEVAKIPPEWSPAIQRLRASHEALRTERDALREALHDIVDTDELMRRGANWQNLRDAIEKGRAVLAQPSPPAQVAAVEEVARKLAAEKYEHLPRLGRAEVPPAVPADAEMRAIAEAFFKQYVPPDAKWYVDSVLIPGLAAALTRLRDATLEAAAQKADIYATCVSEPDTHAGRTQRQTATFIGEAIRALRSAAETPAPGKEHTDGT